MRRLFIRKTAGSARSTRRVCARQWLYSVRLAGFTFAVLALAPAALAETQTVDVRDARGADWQVVIAPAAASEASAAVALQAPDPRQEPVYEPADDERPSWPDLGPRIVRSEEHGVEIVAVERGVAEYADLYRSIPFSRAEYDANPSYRHDAVMELLTGNPRPPVYAPADPWWPAAGFAPFDPYWNWPDRVFPYPAFGYKGRYYPAHRTVYGVNYNLWYPLPGVFRPW